MSQEKTEREREAKCLRGGEVRTLPLYRIIQGKNV